MSMMYCYKHARMFDMDLEEECPTCKNGVLDQYLDQIQKEANFIYDNFVKTQKDFQKKQEEKKDVVE